MAQHATSSDYTGDYLHDRDRPFPGRDAAKEHQPMGSSNERYASTESSEQPSLFQLAEDAVRRNPMLAVAAVASVSALAVMALKYRKRPASGIDLSLSDIGSRLRDIERRAVPQIRRAERQLQKSLSQSRLADGVADLAASLTSRLAALDSGQLDRLKDRASEALSQVASKVGVR